MTLDFISTNRNIHLLHSLVLGRTVTICGALPVESPMDAMGSDLIVHLNNHLRFHNVRRCDLLYHSCCEDIDAGELTSFLSDYAIRPRLVVANQDAHGASNAYKLGRYCNQERIPILTPSFSQYRLHNPVHPGFEIFNCLRKAFQFFPFLAVIAAEHCLALGAKSVYMAGQSLFQFEGQEPVTIVGPHDIGQHVRWFRHKLETDPRLVLEPRLQKVVESYQLSEPQFEPGIIRELCEDVLRDRFSIAELEPVLQAFLEDVHNAASFASMLESCALPCLPDAGELTHQLVSKIIESRRPSH